MTAPQSFTLDSPSSEPVTVKMQDFKVKDDQCSWVFKVECGAPGIKIDTANTNVDDTQVQISFVEYSNQFVNVEGTILEDDIWLHKNEIPAIYDMNDQAGGEPPNLIYQPYNDSDIQQSIPGRIILEQMNWYNLSYNTYNDYSDY